MTQLPSAAAAQLNPLAPSFDPPTCMPDPTCLPTDLLCTPQLGLPQPGSSQPATGSQLPSLQPQPAQLRDLNSSTSQTPLQLRDNSQLNTSQSTLTFSNKTRHRSETLHQTPNILAKRMQGKHLQLLVQYPHRSTTTWTSATALPAELVAEYLAKTYAIKRKKRSLQMAQFGQR